MPKHTWNYASRHELEMHVWKSSILGNTCKLVCKLQRTVVPTKKMHAACQPGNLASAAVNFVAWPSFACATHQGIYRLQACIYTYICVCVCLHALSLSPRFINSLGCRGGRWGVGGAKNCPRVWTIGSGALPILTEGEGGRSNIWRPRDFAGYGNQFSPSPSPSPFLFLVVMSSVKTARKGGGGESGVLVKFSLTDRFVILSIYGLSSFEL